MIFTEAIFPLFLLVALGGYWTLPQGRPRNLWLLAASAVFYGWWDVKFLALIGAVILAAWVVGLAVTQTRNGKTQLVWLWGGIIANLGLLAVFKYLGFFADSAQAALASLNMTASWPVLNIILPVGISFYIFQSISYMVDVWRGQLPPERRPSHVAIYVGFFRNWWPGLSCAPRVSCRRSSATSA